MIYGGQKKLAQISCSFVDKTLSRKFRVNSRTKSLVENSYPFVDNLVDFFYYICKK